jgi:hypothetical protein
MYVSADATDPGWRILVGRDAEVLDARRPART